MENLYKNLIRKIYQITRTPRVNTNIKVFLSSASNQASNGPVTEAEIVNILRTKLPGAKIISVEDTSGGCGAMFNVSIEASEFKGLSIMKQHRIVYDVLKEQIRTIHGIHLETRVAK